MLPIIGRIRGDLPKPINMDEKAYIMPDFDSRFIAMRL
jgi:hypothetical protein